MHSIISGGENAVNENQELEWSDDEADPQVENLLKMIEQGYPFTHSTFTGGVTKLDVIRLREETKAESLNRKTSKTKHASSSQIPTSFDIEVVAAVVKDSVKDDFTCVDTKLATIRESTLSFQTQVISDLRQMLSKVEECSENITLLSHATATRHTFGPEGQHGGPNTTPSMKNAATQTNVVLLTVVEKTVGLDNQSLPGQFHVSILLNGQ